MNRAYLRYTPEFILIIYLLLFFWIKKPYEEWDRVINSDGKGYYGYLTSIFIYDDLDYTFIEDYESKYYPSDGTAFKEFRMPFKGEIVNKTFPGLAILWLPFFLIAHMLSLIAGFEADGYSIIYQYAIGFAALFYLWLGSKWLFKLTRQLGATLEVSSIITIAILLGTNITYYAIVEPSMGHVYSFCLITGFTYFTYNAFYTNRLGWYALAITAYAISIIIRPTNAIFIFLVVIIAGNPKEFRQKLLQFFHHSKAIIISLLVFLIIIAIPPLIWHAHSGYFFVWSYGEEGFNFFDPYFFSILFSYNKGWFIYTPIALIAMSGFIGIYRYSKFQFWVLLFLLTLHIYITSSWWVWHYTSKFSQRVFIDIYVVLAFLLVFLFRMINKKQILKRSLIVIIMLLIGFNLLQFYQHSKWVFPYGYITKDIYWDSFNRLTPRAKVYIPHGKIIKSNIVKNNFEEKKGWSNEVCIVNKDNNHYMQLDSSHLYSAEFREIITPYFSTNKQVIKVKVDVNSNLQNSIATMVVEFQCKEFTYSYNPFYMGNYNHKNKWVTMEYAVYVPDLFTTGDYVKIFFYNPEKNETLLIDNLEIEFISLIEEEELLDGIDLPEAEDLKLSEFTYNPERTNQNWHNTGCFAESPSPGDLSCLIDHNNPYSLTFEAPINQLSLNERSCLIISADIFSEIPVTSTRIIADLPALNDNSGYYPIFISDKINPNEWTSIQSALMIPDSLDYNKSVKIYFWNPSKEEKVYIDNMKIQFLSF